MQRRCPTRNRPWDTRHHRSITMPIPRARPSAQRMREGPSDPGPKESQSRNRSAPDPEAQPAPGMEPTASPAEWPPIHRALSRKTRARGRQAPLVTGSAWAASSNSCAKSRADCSAASRRVSRSARAAVASRARRRSAASSATCRPSLAATPMRYPCRPESPTANTAAQSTHSLTDAAPRDGARSRSSETRAPSSTRGSRASDREPLREKPAGHPEPRARLAAVELVVALDPKQLRALLDVLNPRHQRDPLRLGKIPSEQIARL
jgi:hypothetical protein